MRERRCGSLPGHIVFPVLVTPSLVPSLIYRSHKKPRSCPVLCHQSHLKMGPNRPPADPPERVGDTMDPGTFLEEHGYDLPPMITSGYSFMPLEHPGGCHP